MERKAVSGIVLILLLLGLLQPLLFEMLTAKSVKAQTLEAEIVPDPEYGCPGEIITFHGYNFIPISGEKVSVELWENELVSKIMDIGLFETDSNGEFTGTFTISDLPFGLYTMKAVQAKYNVEAYLDILIVCMEVILSTYEGPPGTEVTLRGKGFSNDATWNATFGDIAIFKDENVDSNGDIIGSFFVPNVDVGTYTITVMDIYTYIEVTVNFNVVQTHTHVFSSASGKGMWIWRLNEIGDGNIDTIEERCKNSGVKWVAVKCGDGVDFWSEQCMPSIIAQFHDAGIKFLGWQYIYGDDPVSEAAVAINILGAGVDGFILDAEGPYEGKPDNAIVYLETIRGEYPDNFIAYTTFPIIDYHINFPYLEFGKYCDAVMPQTYWKELGVTPEEMIEWMEEQWNKWHDVWKAGGYIDSIKPIIPLGQGYEVSGDEITEFCKLVYEHDYGGVSLFRYGTMNDENWEAYAKCFIPSGIWTVDDDLQDYPSADFTRIQDAVDAATAGDTVLVYPGTYTENVEVDKDYLTIKSKRGADVTIVQAANPRYYVFEISDVFQPTVDFVNLNGFMIKGVTNPDFAGIHLSHAKHCTISNNIVSNNRYGINLDYSSNNNISNNTFINGGLYIYDSFQNTVVNNTVNSKPLVYLEDVSNHVVIDAGQVILINSNDITVKNLDLSNTNVGLQFWRTKYCRILNNTFLNNCYGIYLHSSCNNTISNNTISNNVFALDVCNSNKNVISDNIILNNDNGIHFWISSNNIISSNTIKSNNYNAILFRYSDSNKLYLNNFVENSVYLEKSTNIWNSLEKITYIYKGKTYTNYLGNYWTDYTGSDADKDGIGDAHYRIDGDSDNYPLMEPVENYITPSPPPTIADSFRFPVDKPWTQGRRYGKWYDDWKGHHLGEDMLKDFEAPVYAPANGVVKHNAKRTGYGYVVVIEHELMDGTFVCSVLGHLREQGRMPVGSRVTKGQVVGHLSSLPDESGGFIHVHFGIRKDRYSTEPDIDGKWRYRGYAPTYIVDSWYPPYIFIEYYNLHKKAPEAVMKIKLKSPADLIVTDPERITITKGVCEVPGMFYIELRIDDNGNLEDVVILFEQKIGDYIITVIPEPDATPTDKYTLEVLVADTIIVMVDNVQIGDIPDQPYLIESTETEIVPIIPATIDFDPDSLNVKSEGQWVAVYIELPIGHGYDVSYIQLDSIVLNNKIPAEVEPFEIGDYDDDGIPDLMVKFDRRAVQYSVILGPVEMIIRGSFMNSVEFQGADIVLVIN